LPKEIFVLRLGLALAFMAIAPAASADEGWMRLQSSNFDIYSTAGASITRESLQQFEQLRAFFAQSPGLLSALDGNGPQRVPVRIVTFGNPNEYEPYAPWKIAAAHYQPGPERDTIVMSRSGAGSLFTAAHEYFHLVAYRAGLKAPVWLSEGLAELHSTLRYEGNAITVGEIIPARLRGVRDQTLVPLSVIVDAGRESAFFTEKTKANTFYNEAWALTHMLALGEAYAAKWPEFLRAIQAGKPSAEALTATYGKSMDTIERDLTEYVRGDRFASRLYKLPARAIERSGATQSRPGDFDVKLLLVDLSRRRSPVEQTRRRLLALAAEKPKRPEPYTQLGYLAWQTTGAGDAAKWFEKAYALGARGPELLWDYGRLAAGRRPKQAARVLQELVAREPAREDARIELAAVQVANNKPSDAIATLGAGPWTPDKTPRVLSVVAAAELKRNRPAAAKSAIERLLACAKSGEYRELALRLQASLR
jgi:Tetratricopeptide repeat/Protein of unknown function (DUF1570)